MSLKDFLLISCAVVATTVTVRSESTAQSGAQPEPALAASAKGANVSDTTGLPLAAGPQPYALTAAPPSTGTAANGAAAQSGKIDLSALYFFASQNAVARVAAEIRLIRSKHPDWQPPADLFASKSSLDEQPLWDLFAKHDLAGLHALMETMARDNPGWQPSSDLTGKVGLAEAHDAMVKASDAHQWADVITAATSNKMLLTCNDLDALWRTAEALAKSGDDNRALEAYSYTLKNCGSSADRLATVQKASLALQRPEALDSLIKMGRQGPDGRGEFDDIRLDRFRRKIGDATTDGSAPAPSQDEIAAVAASAKSPAGKTDAELLGWYDYAHANYPDAQQWFRTALAADATDSKAAEGLVLALREGGNNDEARLAALQYAGLDVPNRKLMVELISTGLTDPTAKPLSDGQLAAYIAGVDEFKSQDGAQALRWYADHTKNKTDAATWTKKFVQWKGEEIEGLRSSEGAEALGWSLYQNKDMTGAETWFQKSDEWAANESAAVGLVMTAHELHHAKDYAARVARYRGLYPSVAKIGASMQASAKIWKNFAKPVRYVARKPATNVKIDRSGEEIASSFSAGRYADVVASLDRKYAKGSEPRGLSVLRGWALFHQGDWEGAKRVFTNLDGGRYSNERAEGLRVIDFSYSNPRYR